MKLCTVHLSASNFLGKSWHGIFEGASTVMENEKNLK